MAAYHGSMQRFDSLLLSALGVLIVHQVAYMTSSLVGYETSIVHGSLAVAWFGGSMLALGALARSLTHSLQRRNHTSLSPWALSGSIAAGYLLMEQFERAVDGYGTLSIFLEPVFWLGMLAAPLVAYLLHWSVRSLVELIEDALLAPAQTYARPQRTILSPLVLELSPLVVPLDSVSRRGPPAGRRS